VVSGATLGVNNTSAARLGFQSHRRGRVETGVPERRQPNDTADRGEQRDRERQLRGKNSRARTGWRPATAIPLVSYAGTLSGTFCKPAIADALRLARRAGECRQTIVLTNVAVGRHLATPSQRDGEWFAIAARLACRPHGLAVADEHQSGRPSWTDVSSQFGDDDQPNQSASRGDQWQRVFTGWYIREQIIPDNWNG